MLPGACQWLLLHLQDEELAQQAETASQTGPLRSALQDVSAARDAAQVIGALNCQLYDVVQEEGGGLHGWPNYGLRATSG